jgi:hypothetical protein
MRTAHKKSLLTKKEDFLFFVSSTLLSRKKTEATRLCQPEKKEAVHYVFISSNVDKKQRLIK